MAISGEERRRLIVSAVGELGGRVRLTELADRLGIPAVTVRRDVAALADAGRLSRSHGFVSLERPDDGARPPLAPGPGQGRALGLLVPSVGSYFDEVIAGARAAAAAAGARLVLGIAPYGAGGDRLQAERLLESGAEGLLLAPGLVPGRTAEDYAWLDALPVPAVLVERRSPTPDGPGAGLDTVASDHRHGVLSALRHLAGLGHGSVLLAARGDSWTAAEVRAGYREGTRLLGLPDLPALDMLGPGNLPADPEPLVARIAEAARSGTRALLVHNDQDALRLAPLLRAHGLAVPADVALVAYDDVFAALAAPPLTAVAPPKHAVGAAAVDLLLRRLAAGAELPVHRTALLPVLRVRASCGAERTAPRTGAATLG
ncbi:substrate-binding domain-containing protein [Kitasatospora sp. NPDC056273]|uniref:substrate-binding domain-containing protein n=1 Tax=Kitasatospora sp. NPDC056273 TaxID=3345769 RepID=UPI0035D55F0F